MASPAGAPNAAPRRRRSWWLPVVLLIVLVVLLLLGLSRCGNDDSGDDAATSSASSPSSPSSTSSTSSTSSAPSTGTAPTGTASTTASPGNAAGSLTLGSTDLLSGSADVSDLSQYAGQQAAGTQVAVESVPADEGFWVGSSDTERVWVQLTGSGESPFKVKAGQKVSFTGTVTAHGADFPAKVGVTAAEGAQQLVAQKQHVQVERSALTIAD